MRKVRLLIVALILAISPFLAGPASIVRAQTMTMDDIARANPEELIAQMEAAQRAMGNNGSFEQRAEIAVAQVFLFTLASKVANPEQLAELDAEIEGVNAWLLATRGITATQRDDFAAVVLGYYLDSNRPGVALAYAQRLTGATNTPRQRAVVGPYVARAYLQMGQVDAAAAALDNARVAFDALPGEDLDAALLGYVQVGMEVWAERGDVMKMRDAYIIANRLFHKDELPDTMLFAASFATMNAAVRVNWEWLATQASWYTKLFGKRLFTEGYTAQQIACFEPMWRVPSELAKNASFASFFAQCDKDSQLEQPPREMMLVGARVLELQRRHREAASYFDRALAMGERARSSFDITARQSFYEGSERQFYEGSVRNHAYAALYTGGDPDTFFEAVAAAERMRARQFQDLRGAATSVTAAELKAYAQSLPDGVAVVTITTLKAERIALAFTRTERRVGMVTNLVPETIDQAELKYRALLIDPTTDNAERERFGIAFTASLLVDARHILPSAKRVIVAIDGSPSLIPAAAWSTSDQTYRPLGESAQIDYVSTLQSLLSPPRPASSSAGLFAVGDPVFPEIPLPPGLTLEQVRAISAQAGATRDRAGGLTLTRLENTEFEVRDVARGFPGQARLLFREQASEAAVKRADLRRVRFLHFATHGLLAGDVVGLGEPALALAPGEGEDGFLTASDVQAMKLDADLVVLSACNTGSGRVVAGEGAIGLSRAFLVAGSRAVLASLWPVDDATTEQFMGAFYQRLRAGKSASTALSETSAEIRARQPHPKYWAPFILVTG